MKLQNHKKIYIIIYKKNLMYSFISLITIHLNLHNFKKVKINLKESDYKSVALAR